MRERAARVTRAAASGMVTFAGPDAPDLERVPEEARHVAAAVIDSGCGFLALPSAGSQGGGVNWTASRPEAGPGDDARDETEVGRLRQALRVIRDGQGLSANLLREVARQVLLDLYGAAGE